MQRARSLKRIKKLNQKVNMASVGIQPNMRESTAGRSAVALEQVNNLGLGSGGRVYILLEPQESPAGNWQLEKNPNTEKERRRDKAASNKKHNDGDEQQKEECGKDT